MARLQAARSAASGPQPIRAPAPPRLAAKPNPRVLQPRNNNTQLQARNNNTQLQPKTNTVGAWGPGTPPVDNYPAPMGASSYAGGSDTSAMTGLDNLSAVSPVVTPPDPTSDPQYQEELAALVRSLSDYQNQIGSAKSQYDIGYNDNMRQLGWNNETGALDANNKGGYYGQALLNNTNDYASRGMLTSGLYLQSDDDISTDYNNRAHQFIDARQGFNDQQNQQLESYQAQDQASRAAILRNALARISAGITGA